VLHAEFYATMAGAYSWTSRISDGLAKAMREICERLDLQGYGPLLRSLPLFFWSIAGSVSEGHRLADEARQRSDPK